MYNCNIAIDLEFTPAQKNRTGLKKEIIEIGAVKVSDDGEVSDTFQTLVNPLYSYDVSVLSTFLRTFISAPRPAGL